MCSNKYYCFLKKKKKKSTGLLEFLNEILQTINVTIIGQQGIDPHPNM